MHYTSVENIHKVIDSLFLDDLKAEFSNILTTYKSFDARKKHLLAFQEKIASLKFLDPACGSGNFLTETYLSLRRLENKIILELNRGLGQFDFGGEHSPVKVHIHQFYGIEINDFACAVAETALWIAESQMLKETEDIIGASLDFFPLKTNTNIHEGNALRMDWTSVLPKEELSFIMGNPPFSGKMSDEQKREITDIFENGRLTASLDYVCGWYKKASDLIQGTSIGVAFVSTNSITQGEQVAPLWYNLLENGVKLNFAHKTFCWDSEASSKAHIYCVIIGFSMIDKDQKKVWSYETPKSSPELQYFKKLSPYLRDEETVLVWSSGHPLFTNFKLTKGNQPTDDGNFILSKDERAALLKKCPSVAPYVRHYLGGEDFLYENEPLRYCLWLKDAPVDLISSCGELKRRVKAIREFRLKSTAKPTRDKADSPTEFFSNPQKDRAFLAIPRVSGESRSYIPMGFIPQGVIASDSVSIVPEADLYAFGILTSSAHMAWMRAVAGRLKSDYRYSGGVVFNTFVWPDRTKASQTKIEKTAQAILDARARHPNQNLAGLYNESMMPKELRKAHRDNDQAVLKAYGLPPDATEETIVAHLMGLYTEKVAEVERREAVEAAVRKALGKTEPPKDIEALKSKVVAGYLTLEALIEQLKTWKKVRATEARKAKKAEN